MGTPDTSDRHLRPTAQAGAGGLVVRNLLFSLVVPGLGAVVVPWWILGSSPPAPQGAAWFGTIPIACGLVLYLACVRVFAAVGRGTPGPWDAPRRVVTVGPYGWVRNPIYLGALLVVLGEAWIFRSWALLGYAAAMAACFHLFVVGYEEPRLRRAFGSAYSQYTNRVGRWIPRRPVADAPPESGPRGGPAEGGPPGSGPTESGPPESGPAESGPA